MKDMMHITMSFADGSPARISSINTALRHFRPSFVHIWELKTFWHEKVICEDDVEVRPVSACKQLCRLFGCPAWNVEVSPT